MTAIKWRSADSVRKVEFKLLHPINSPQALNNELALKPTERRKNIILANVPPSGLAIQPIPNLASSHRAFRQQFDGASALAA